MKRQHKTVKTVNSQFNLARLAPKRSVAATLAALAVLSSVAPGWADDGDDERRQGKRIDNGRMEVHPVDRKSVV